MRLLIARHAEDIGRGTRDENRGLTKKGQSQAAKLREAVIKFQPTDLVTSTLTRAKQTAEIISGGCGIELIEVDFFKEQISGSSSLDASPKKETKGYVNPHDRFLNGETYSDLAKRAKKAWKWLLQEFDSGGEERRVVVITHGRFMTFFIGGVLGFPVDGFFLAISNVAYLIIKIRKSWRPQLVMPVPGEDYI